MGRLERHLDQDLIDRMEAGWTPTSVKKVPKKPKPPRPAATYRGARRNAARGSTWRGYQPDGRFYRPPIRMNRSKKWDGVATVRPYR